MRIGLAMALGLLLLGAGCSAQPPPAASRPAGVLVAATPQGGASTAAVTAETEQLRAALSREVPQHIEDTAAEDELWIARAKAVIGPSFLVIDHPQLLVVVDRNPRVQQLRIILAQQNAPWQVIGGSKVSTGQPGRFDYFITPTGVFMHTVGILDYRALGTFNENHIRGLGLKGMRVWDFGWQTADTGWLAQPEPREIRLLMHATDPTYLEQRLGRAASKGCVRIPATMNHFLDVYGVLDADYERAAENDERIRSILRPDRTPTPLAGDAMVVVDSSETN